jgi:hypothetical protein
MSIERRLARLERMVSGGGAAPRNWERALGDIERLRAWLAEHSFADCLAAVESGATAPDGLHDLLLEQAAHDPERRAWERSEKALAAGELPDDADVALLTGRA